MVFVWRPRAWNLTLQRSSVRRPCPNTSLSIRRKATKQDKQKNPGCWRGFSSLTTIWVMRRRWKTQKTGKLLGSAKNHLRRGLFSRSNSAVSEDTGYHAWRERTPKKLCRVQKIWNVLQIDKFHGVTLYMVYRTWFIDEIIPKHTTKMQQKLC